MAYVQFPIHHQALSIAFWLLLANTVLEDRVIEVSRTPCSVFFLLLSFVLRVYVVLGTTPSTLSQFVPLAAIFNTHIYYFHPSTLSGT